MISKPSQFSFFFIFITFFAIAACKTTQAEGNTSQSTSSVSKKTIEPVAYVKEPKKVKMEDSTDPMPKDCFSQQVYLDNQKDCENEDQPVCGCNSVTYKNACLAKKAGLTSYKKGKCVVEATGI